MVCQSWVCSSIFQKNGNFYRLEEIVFLRTFHQEDLMLKYPLACIFFGQTIIDPMNFVNFEVLIKKDGFCQVSKG